MKRAELGQIPASRFESVSLTRIRDDFSALVKSELRCVFFVVFCLLLFFSLFIPDLRPERDRE